MPWELRLFLSVLVVICAIAIWYFWSATETGSLKPGEFPAKPRAHQSIEELSTTPALNNPPGWESMNHWDEHARALYAMVAQLRDRIEELERR